ncbi:MAG: hypothetical protein GKR89_19565 [Candidatus Latescibacteria bacterium]|nr:hypothetical protein [Candidatus Latescibacterota bacterium]
MGDLRKEWEIFYQCTPVFADLGDFGTFTHVDISFTDGCFAPQARGIFSGPDAFELDIGNFIVYARPLWEGGPYFQELRGQWLPYYGETLRRQRLQVAIKYARNNLDHVSLYVDRGLYFQAHKRLYLSVQDFLFGLFVAQRCYPVAYDKWIHDQFINILDLPDLYRRLVALFEIGRLESDELAEKAQVLGAMMDEYLRP